MASGSGGGTMLAVPNVALGTEVFFYANTRRVGDLGSLKDEVDALAEHEWVPATPDFRAITMRSSGMREPRPDAEINSLDTFFKMLLEPVMRFHFFAHVIADGAPTQAIVMSCTTARHSFQIVPELRNGMNLKLLDKPTLQRLDQLAGGSADPLAETIRKVRKLNEDTRRAVRNELGDGVRRELFMYLCEPHPPAGTFIIDDGLLIGLANLLGMDVFGFGFPIFFKPILQLSPPDQFRGRVALQSEPGAEIFTDVHLMRDLATRFP